MLKAKSGKRQPLMRRKGAMPSLTVVIGAPAPPPSKTKRDMPPRARDEDDAEDMEEDEAEAVTLDTLRDEIRALTARLDALDAN
jgi:hypothetical protein